MNYGPDVSIYPSTRWFRFSSTPNLSELILDGSLGLGDPSDVIYLKVLPPQVTLVLSL